MHGEGTMMLIVPDGYTITVFRNVPYSPQVVMYRPRRKAMMGRTTSLPTIGVNLYYLHDQLSVEEFDTLRRMVHDGHGDPLRYLESTGKVYFTWGLDIDSRVRNIDRIVEWLDRNFGVTMLVRTAKGYHVYLHILEDKMRRVIRQVYRIEKQVGDVGHVRLAIKRECSRTLTWGVLRIRGKYRNDMKIVSVWLTGDLEYDRWLLNVIRLIDPNYDVFLN